MKVYETVKLEIIDFLKEDVLTASGGSGEIVGVYERVNDLDPNAKVDWF